MLRPGFTFPIAFLIAITLWVVFCPDPAPDETCRPVMRGSHHGTPMGICALDPR